MLKKCLINHALLPKYAQKFEDKERKKHNSNLNQFFHFFNFCFLVESHYPDHPLFEQTFFRKNFFFFLIIFNTVLFFLTTFILDITHFFYHFQKYFCWRKRIRHSFFRFFSFIQNTTLSYFEKETKWETFFCIFFFRSSKHIFLFWQVRVNFSNFNDVIKFIDTKTGKHFF